MSSEGEEPNIPPELRPGDEKFIGLDDELEWYYIGKRKWKIKPAGLYTKKKIREQLTPIDNIAQEMAQLDIKKPDGMIKFNKLNADLDVEKEKAIFEVVPQFLEEEDGKPFNQKKWFGDQIPAATWWDVVRDLYLFLQGKGSRDVTLRSMMQSSTDTPTDSNTSTSSTKSISPTSAPKQEQETS